MRRKTSRKGGCRSTSWELISWRIWLSYVEGGCIDFDYSALMFAHRSIHDILAIDSFVANSTQMGLHSDSTKTRTFEMVGVLLLASSINVQILGMVDWFHNRAQKYWSSLWSNEQCLPSGVYKKGSCPAAHLYPEASRPQPSREMHFRRGIRQNPHPNWSPRHHWCWQGFALKYQLRSNPWRCRRNQDPFPYAARQREGKPCRKHRQERNLAAPISQSAAFYRPECEPPACCSTPKWYL